MVSGLFEVLCNWFYDDGWWIFGFKSFRFCIISSKVREITFLVQCNGPPHVPFPVTPHEPLRRVMCCNFTNKTSDDLLRTLPHGPAFPTLRYWTGTIMCCSWDFQYYDGILEASHYQSDRTHHAIDFVNWWTLMTVQLDTTSESHFWRTSLTYLYLFFRGKRHSKQKNGEENGHYHHQVWMEWEAERVYSQVSNNYSGSDNLKGVSQPEITR